MAGKIEYAPATEDAPAGRKPDKKRRAITWLAIGGAVGALLLGVAAVSFASGQANAPQVAADGTAPDAEWQEWHNLASPTISAAGEKWIAATDAASEGDMDTFAALAEESADLWASIPDSPSTDLDAIFMRTSAVVALSGEAALDGRIAASLDWATTANDYMAEFVEIMKSQNLI